MTFKIGQRVRVKSVNMTGTIDSYCTGTKTTGYRTVKDPDDYTGLAPLLCHVEYDTPVWHGDMMRGYEKTIRRGIHAESDLSPA